jgi:outer membrane protein OmpA-like peptidoglycan-associated protein
MAEDARIIAVKKIDDEQLAAERAAAAQREATARAQADAEAARRAQAEADRAAAEHAKRDAEITALRARKEAADAEALRAAALARQQTTQAEAEAAQAAMAARQRTADAEVERARLAADEASRAKQQAETDRLKAEAQRAELQRAADAEVERARLAVDQASRAKQQAETDRLKAEAEKAELRNRLEQQLNSILETRQTARGLIVSMPDVLFDFDSATLKPEAREKLAKIAGILLAYPDLRVEVEGHTDSVGSEEYNQRLSEHRAQAVRDYLIGNGEVSTSTIVAANGFGKSRPIASNDTPAGRQRNRRVELVVSGGVLSSRR